MKYPRISIVIATFNSEKTLTATLTSIQKQSYPQNRIEILIVDGGSHDKTLKIAKNFKTKIIPNPKTELIYAKYLGFYQASGQYLIYLDSDEILANPRSLEIKQRAINAHPKVKAVMLGGYKSPLHSAEINNYINEFGDPFSFFMYRESKGDCFLLKDFSKRFRKQMILHSDDCIVINFKDVQPLPLIELWAGGSMFDLEYAKKSFPQIKKNPDLIAHLFYLLNKKGNYLAITKNDYTIHNSVPYLSKYLKKIVSRIRNNVFNTDMGKGGYVGRELIQSKKNNLARYLFIPYALTLIFPLYDGISLSISRRKLIYLLHPFLCFYTAFYICYFLILKQFSLKPQMGTYGN